MEEWSTAGSRGVSRLLVHCIEVMGETCPESEDPLVLNSEGHFLVCAGVTGFSDECHDMARDMCGVREGEMSS